MANITGTLIPDLILPNAVLQGEILPDLAGDDIIDVLDADDVVTAAAGNDSVVGGNGNDLIFGNSGNDTLEGNSGNDTLSAGRDDDLVFGGEGDDWMFGNRGQDNIRGGLGDDTIFGGRDNDLIQGEEGNDVLYGDLGADTVNGGGGDDTFVVARRADALDAASTGGAFEQDADVFQDFRQQGNDVIRLEGGMTFADLQFTDQTVNGVPTGNAVIRDAGGTGNFLAVVQGRTAAELAANPDWFVTDTPTPPTPTPGASTVQFSTATFQQQEGNGVTTNAAVTITRTGDTTQAAEVAFATTSLGAANPATAGTDFTPVNTTVNFAPGQTTATVNVPILPDANVETDNPGYAVECNFDHSRFGGNSPNSPNTSNTRQRSGYHCW